MGANFAQEPSASAATTPRVDVNVTSFGADPTGIADSAQAVKAAIKRVKRLSNQGKATRLVFPTGTYQLYPEHAEVRELYVSNTVGANQTYRNKTIAMLAEGVHDVIIDGQGSRLTMHGQLPQLILAISLSAISPPTGLPPPRVIDLTVVKKGTTHGQPWREFRIPDGYQVHASAFNLTIASENSPYTGKPYWRYTNLRTGFDLPEKYLITQKFSLSSGQNLRVGWGIQPALFNGATSVRLTPQRTLRVSYLPGMNVDSTIGDSFQMRTKVRDTPGGLIWKSKRTTLENLQMGYLHGFGILAQFSTDLTVRNCDFRPPSDSWRTTAAFADILHVSGARGHIRIYDNNFGFAHDDPINVHGTYVQMVARGQDSHTPTFRYMHSETAGFPQVSVGDQVTLVNRDTLQDLPWRARVTAVSGPSGRDHKNSLTTMSVTFDKPLPGAALPHVVALENLTYSPAVTIRHNHFESIPTRGILVTTRKPVLIKNNVFDQMQMASIYISGDVNGWYESSVVRNVTIRRNVFIRPGLGSDVAQPVIFISPTSGGRDPARAAHSHVKIYDNVFLMEDTGVLDAKNVRDLRFNNNRVTHYLPDSQLKAKASTHSLAVGEMTQLTAESTNSANTPLVTLRGSRDVDLSGNHLDSTFNRSVALKNTSATSVRSDAALPVGKESPAAVHRWIVSDPRLANVSTSGRLTARKTGVVAIFPVYYDGIKEIAGDPV